MCLLSAHQSLGLTFGTKQQGAAGRGGNMKTCGFTVYTASDGSPCRIVPPLPSKNCEQTTRITCVQPRLREPPHPLRFCFLWVPSHSGIPTQKFPRSLVHPSALTSCCFGRSHMKSPVAEQGTGSQNVIRNIGAVGLHQKRHLGTPCRAHPSLEIQWQMDFGAVVRLLSIKQCVA